MPARAASSGTSTRRTNEQAARFDRNQDGYVCQKRLPSADRSRENGLLDDTDPHLVFFELD